MERRLAAIFAADVVGYSRLMAADEAGTHARLKALRKDFLEPTTAQHHGRVVKLMGDGTLIEFASVVDAVHCAVEIQRGVVERNAGVPEDQRIQFRIGVNLGDVIIEGDDIYGDGVNIAARLEGLAEPGGIVISGTALDHAKNKAEAGFRFLGRQPVKNIPEPVRAYQVLLDPAAAGTIVGEESGKPSRPRWIATAAAVFLIAAAAGAVGWLRPWERAHEPGATLSLPDKPSIAVLPFENLSADPQEEYFADGLTDDLITDLSKISGLFTIARNSVFTYKDKAVDIRQIANDLGVRYVLEGSVRRAGGRIRINAQLIDGTTGSHIWAERYDREYADIFALQDEVIGRIVGALSVQLTESEQTQVARLPTRSLEAYDYYLRAEQEFHSPSADVGMVRAMALYDKAISLDDQFADAYAGYARAAAFLWVFSYDAALAGAVARQDVYETAGRALERNPELPRAHAVLAEMQMVDGEHEAAIQSARRAVDLGPSDAEAYATLALVLAYAGRPAEAVTAVEIALRLNPKPPATILLTAGLALFLDEQYERAIAPLQRAVEIAPRLNEPREFLAMTYAQAGQLDRARIQAKTLLGQQPSLSLKFYQALYAHHRRPEDLARRIEGLRKAGIPEWPFGYQDQTESRIESARARDLTFGQTWQGQQENGEPFFVQVSEDGTTAYSSPSSLRTVSLFLRGDMLCSRSADFMLGRPNCGYLYRDHDNVGETKYDYVYVNAFSLMHFSVADQGDPAHNAR